MESKVYALLDERNRVMQIDGGYSIQNVDVDTWTYIDEGEGDRYNLCQNNYLDKLVYESHGIPQYKYVDGEIVERTQAEIDADIAAIPTPTPTQEEKNKANIDYIAMMTDVELPSEV